uniref:Uncharacterized protein LOC110201236 n=1 Tax=Phascolarctos cinereus TaxID=38626 RepID=A0A6P5JDQ3_PHACI|nr:uncharacterized protein LOC110201236 [Phascolarctos cinereus]
MSEPPNNMAPSPCLRLPSSQRLSMSQQEKASLLCSSVNFQYQRATVAPIRLIPGPSLFSLPPVSVRRKDGSHPPQEATKMEGKMQTERRPARTWEGRAAKAGPNWGRLEVELTRLSNLSNVEGKAAPQTEMAKAGEELGLRGDRIRTVLDTSMTGTSTYVLIYPYGHAVTCRAALAEHRSAEHNFKDGTHQEEWRVQDPPSGHAHTSGEGQGLRRYHQVGRRMKKRQHPGVQGEPGRAYVHMATPNYTRQTQANLGERHQRLGGGRWCEEAEAEAEAPCRSWS